MVPVRSALFDIDHEVNEIKYKRNRSFTKCEEKIVQLVIEFTMPYETVLTAFLRVRKLQITILDNVHVCSSFILFILEQPLPGKPLQAIR